ncbi:hypothetical protein Vadar_018148 [Vaccinium darrowii]|uniref:Uncharacterized protein n=1 Tax=Vaccinium darrowii TaxID=229202 RepID=A0ACB7YMT3_9ERIC|nr:hypothetical protein Vadar_018148 [Vaccinium darrowii]
MAPKGRPFGAYIRANDSDIVQVKTPHSTVGNPEQERGFSCCNNPYLLGFSPGAQKAKEKVSNGEATEKKDRRLRNHVCLHHVKCNILRQIQSTIQFSTTEAGIFPALPLRRQVKN